MNKLKMFAGVAATVVGLALPVAASASTNLTFLTLNGAANATVAAGDSLDAKITYNISSGSDVESAKWEIIGSGLPPVCVDLVPDHLNSGTFVSQFPIDTQGATEGTWSVKVSAYGIGGTGADNNCGGSVNDTMTFSNVLTLTAEETAGNVANNTQHGGTSGGSGTTGVSAQIAALSAAIQAFIASLHSTTTPPVTGNAAKCDVVRPYLGAQPFAYSSVGVQLQSALLLDDPTSIPALKAGATIPMGYFGPQTHAALTNFSSKYGCGFIFN